MAWWRSPCRTVPPQRGEIDKLGDTVGYSGDGAALFPDPGVANMVSEPGSAVFDHIVGAM